MEVLLVFGCLLLLGIPVLGLIALVMMVGLRQRVRQLEQQVAGLLSAAGPATSAPMAQSAPVSVLRPTPTQAPEPEPEPIAQPVIHQAHQPAEPPPPKPSPNPQPQPQPQPQPNPAPREPNFLQRWLAAGKHWLSEGNVPVKVGMLVLLAGLAALLKYAADQGWLQLPIALRLSVIAALALLGLGLGWRQRLHRRAFALALQGGSIGVLLLVVFAAFKLYALLPAALAFAMSVVLVAVLCALAVKQESRTLAILGTLAGFMAPIWLSTGAGNHVALFSYYAVLNLGVFVIAWLRPWRELNLLGFIFTFGIGSVWGVLSYQSRNFASTEPFLLLFFLFYLLIPLLHARRQQGQQRSRVDGSLVFGTPLVAFALQAALLSGDHLRLGLCAMVLALLYAGLAWRVLRAPQLQLLGQSYLMLAVGFATLAVPLALSARVTSCVFALEGAALVWLGVKQRHWISQVSGGLLQLAAALSLSFDSLLWHSHHPIFFNSLFLAGMLLALAGFASAYVQSRAGHRGAAGVFHVWALWCWVWSFGYQIDSHCPDPFKLDALLALTAVTAWVSAEVFKRKALPAFAWTSLAALPAAWQLLLAQVSERGQPLSLWGAVAWLLFAIAGMRMLPALVAAGRRRIIVAQLLWWLLWPCLLSVAGWQFCEQHDLAIAWAFVAVAWPWCGMLWLGLPAKSWLSWPLAADFDPVRRWLLAVPVVLLVVSWLLALLVSGAAIPLPWLPLLNPLALMQLLELALLLAWLRTSQAPSGWGNLQRPIMAAAGFVLATVMLLRGVHHWGGVAWDAQLWQSSLTQMGLTLLWSVLGMAAWIAGSRRGWRLLWQAGAVLMAVVLLKLVLIDRQHLGNLLGIGSFIGYGLLCTAVGYVAPAPPRPQQTQS